MPDTLQHTAVVPRAVPHRQSADTLTVRRSHARTELRSTADSLQLDSLAADSARLHRIDHSADYPFPLYCTADSLRALEHQLFPAPRQVEPRQIYGTLVTEVPPSGSFLLRRLSLTDNWAFQSLVLALAVTYFILLYRHLDDIRNLFERISRDTSSSERRTEEPGSNGFSRFLNLTSLIGMLFMGVLVVKYSDSLMPVQLAGVLPHTAILALTLLTVLAWCCVGLYQWLTISLIGAVTLYQNVTRQLLMIKRSYFSLLVIIVSPVLLLYALCPHGTGTVLFYVVAAELIITLLLYFKETLNLFLAKKISILHWFLYLCTIEILPISYLCLITVR